MNNNESNTTLAAPLDGEEQQLLTVSQAAHALNISRWLVYQLINDGRLQSVRIKRRRLITPAALNDLVELLRDEAEDTVDGR